MLAVRRVEAASSVCGSPGLDGSPGTLSGVYNTYYAPPAGILSAATTTFSLGTMDTANGGAATAVVVNDELLIIQMQDGSFNSINGPTYGSGTGSLGTAGNDGTGYTSLGSAGLYEYVKVTAVTGTTVTVVGGGGGGLLNTYTEAAATGTSGQETYQIVRVPQYLTATLSSTFRAAYWDGQTGGVAALDLASTLNLGGATVYATADGFRGGGLTYQTSSPGTWSSGDYMESSLAMTPPPGGSKGEGLMGSPNYTFNYTNFTAPAAPTAPTVTSSGINGYPGGDQTRGAPGNAGGGGTDDDPPANDQNTGGGGGANGGGGGDGGYPWTPSYTGNTAQYDQYPYTSGAKTYAPYVPPSITNFADVGGRGGSAIGGGSVGPTRAFMGGGGGEGVNNNNSNNNAYNNYGSSGGPGGGIVMLRIAQTSGAGATIQADGETGLAPLNDGGGGGGAGGTVIVTSPSTFSGITVSADGAAGTTANATNGSIAEQHGPGGGGGGGIVMSSSSVGATVSGGPSGTTTTLATTYGATAGTSGQSLSISAAQIPGISSGAECYSGTGANPLYTGPTYATDTTYGGANLTGSFDGSVPITTNNDVTAVGIPTGTTQLINSSTTPGAPAGNTFATTAPITIQIPHSFYYDDTVNNGNHVLTISAQSPTGWTAEICADSYSNGKTPPLPAPTTPNCADNNTGTACKASKFTAPPDNWINAGTVNPPSNLYVATYCVPTRSGPFFDWYWVIYTIPTGTSLTAFQRYDASITASDTISPPDVNTTHDEFYPGFVPLTKSQSVAVSGCPAGVTPSYLGQPICPSGILQYSIDYRNIVLGGGLGTEGQLSQFFPESGAGTLVITDDGTLSSASQKTISNWATFTNGLYTALSAGLGSNTACGTTPTSPCGDTTVGTTFAYTGGLPSGVGATKFTATVGGGTFQLYPFGITGQTNQGSITFAVKVK